MTPSIYRLCCGFLGLGLLACTPHSDSDALEISRITVDRTEDRVVARVNNTNIYQSDVRRAAEAQGLIGAEDRLSSDDSIYTVTLDELIDQRLLALDAVRVGLDSDDEVQRRLAAARDRVLGNYRIESHLADKITDEAVRDLYDAQRALAGRGEERRVRQIVLEDEATARDVAARLDDEEDFEQLVSDYSVDEDTRERGGERGWVSRSMLSAPLRGPIFNTAVGSRSAPTQIDEQWYIFDVIDTRTPSSRSFEDVKEDITRFMTFEAVDSLLKDLQDRGEIERITLALDDAKMSPADEETTTP